MIQGSSMAFALAIDATSATNGATITSQLIDTLPNNQKCEYLTLAVWGSTADVVSDSPSVLKLQEADVTNTSSFTDIVAFVGGTATSATVGFVIPNDVTATQQLIKYSFFMNLLPRKRYIRALISPRTTQTLSALAILTRGAIAPSTLVSHNVQGVVVTG